MTWSNDGKETVMVMLKNGETWDETKPRPRWENLAPGQCKECDDPGNPVSHFGSPVCRSHGLGALGGTRAHCTCDACF